MLFGNKDFREEVLKDAMQYAEQKNIKLVYGAMVGGISKGTQYRDSDYDTRFLYINNDFPQKIYIPDKIKEEELVHRYYPAMNKPYEWIPCWELTSFLQFLVNPCMDGKLSVGLYNIVGWTFLSPYTWDPYGIQNKIIPLLSTIFNCKYALEYHINQANVYLENSKKELVIKDYLYGIYSVLSIDWILKYNSFSPIYMRSLVASLNDERVKSEIENLIEKSIIVSNNYIDSGKSKNLHDSHFIGAVSRSEIIDNYVSEVMEESIIKVAEVQDTKEEIEHKKKMLDRIYNILDYSFNQEQCIRGVNDDK